MRIAELLERLRRSGIELRAQGEQLLVNAPKGAVTAEIAASIRDHKREILEFLAHAAGAPTTAAARIERVSRDRPIPLSSGQQRLWYIDQLEPGSSAYNMPLALEVSGPLDVGALKRALDSVVARHEALRTAIHQGPGGEPHQVVLQEVSLDLPVTDLSAHASERRESECDALLASWSREAFDLAKAPLLRARVIRLRPDDHVLFFMPHHVVYDGLSHEIFQHELLASYTAALTGKPAELPELPIQYADYAAWQQTFAHGKEVDAHLAFWKQQLGGELPVLELPTRGPRPAEQTTRGGTVELTLPAPLVQALGELGRKDGTTIFMTLLAGYNALLARYAGQDELVVGTPIANRPHQETGGLIGFFANTLALKSQLHGDPSFREIMKRTRDTCLASYAHQDAPFDRIVAELKPPRDRSRTPVFQCMFSLDEQAGAEGITAGGIRIIGHRPCGTGASRTDLTLWLRRSPHGVLGTFEYNSDLFDRALIEQMAESYRLLLQGALRAPDAKLSELPLLDERAREHLVHERNATHTPFPAERALHQWFELAAQRTPSRTAIRSGETSLTFAELDARANQLAHHLVALGVGPEQRVAVCVPRSTDMVVALLGVLKAGGAYVPLDPGYPVDRLGMMLEDSGAIVLLVSEASAEVLDSSVAPDVKRVSLDRDWHEISTQNATAPALTFSPNQLAYLIYTSGSTGKPKGVMIEHRTTANFFVGMADRLAGGGVWLNDTSISFDISVLELFGALGHGFEVVVRRELLDESESVPALIARHGVTHFQCTPSQAGMLVVDGAGRKALARLSLLMLGGEPLPAKLARELKTHLGGALVNVYGPTETTVWSTMQVLENVTDPVSIGRPIANTRVYVLDAQQRLLPDGVLGELWIGGAGVARGYHGRPELTRERFLSDPFASDGSRMYRTGDMVRYRVDGTLEHRGRTDFQVKLRGHRIELGEIESALRNHPAVRDAVVSLREDVAGDPRLVGYVILEAEVALDETALRASLRQKLTEIMVPSQFVAMESFPLTPNGKVDRRALPKPDASATTADRAYVAPQSSVERAIAEVWREILHVERVGLHDNFFDLGGHSLRVVAMVRRLQEQHGIELSLGSVFAAPTVHELAKRAALPPADESESFVLPLREGGNNLSLFCICGLHLYQPLAQALGDGQPVYGIFVPAEGHMFDGAGAEPERFPDVAELASEYVKAVRRQQPHGPYAVAGISFGGILAYEVAQQLTAMGEEVRVLALFDAILPRGVRKDARLWVTGHLRRLAKQGPRHLFERLGALAQEGRTKAPAAHPEEGQLRKLEDLRERIYVRAMEQYDRDVRPYPGRAIVFRARDQSAFIGYEVDRHCGWSDLVGGGLALHHVEGDHLGILSDPYVVELARTLRSYLDQASRDAVSADTKDPEGAPGKASSSGSAASAESVS